jgi:hypothetical protein
MARLSAEQLLNAWELGLGAGAVDQAILYLEAAGIEAGLLGVGAADRQLLRLRAQVLGPCVSAAAHCAGCGQVVEFELPAEVQDAAEASAGEYILEQERYTVHFRLPTMADASAAAASPDAAAALDVLRTKCIAAAHDLPEGVLAAVGSRMSELAAAGEIVLELRCPACAHTESVAFDAASFVTREFDLLARRTLAEVGALARSYGWSEQDILAMSPRRRRKYLELADR